MGLGVSGHAALIEAVTMRRRPATPGGARAFVGESGWA